METLTRRIREEIYDGLINDHIVNINDLIDNSGNANITFLVLLIDYYNFLKIRRHDGDLKKEDEALLRLIEKSNDLNEVLQYFIHDNYFIRQAIAINYSFSSSSNIEKQNFMYSLYLEDNKNILEDSLLYKLDRLSYMPSQTVKELIKNYDEYLENDKFIIDSDVRAMEEILYSLSILNADFPNIYKKIMLECIHDFYKLDTYRISHNSSNHISKNHLYHFLIRFLTDDKIVEYSKKNKKFTKTVMDMYLYCKYVLSSDDYEEIIKKSENKLSKKLRKKLDNNKKED